MKVLIIGGSGFLGSHLISMLLHRGHDITVQDIVSSSWVSKTIGNGSKIAYRWKSLFDVIPEDLEEFDCVINLAAQADVPLSITSPKWTCDLNVQSTISLLEALRKTRTPTIFMSTDTVYGRVSSDKLPITEESTLNPTNVYSATKVAMEALCHAYRSQFDIPITILRPTSIFGERGRLKQVVPIFVSQALTNSPITLEGDGSQSRDFCYVGNLVEGILKAVDLSDSKNKWGIFNIGSGRETTLKTLADLIIKLTDSRSEVVYKPWRPGEEGVRLSISIEKARRFLKYEPQVSLEDGLAKTINWMRSL